MAHFSISIPPENIGPKWVKQTRYVLIWLTWRFTCAPTFITHFMPLFILYPPENLRKPDVFWCFQKSWKETFGTKLIEVCIVSFRMLRKCKTQLWTWHIQVSQKLPSKFSWNYARLETWSINKICRLYQVIISLL